MLVQAAGQRGVPRGRGLPQDGHGSVVIAPRLLRAVGPLGEQAQVVQEAGQVGVPGGQGFFLGDGRLNYATEHIVETLYNLNLVRGAWVSADWQHSAHPGYNRDRGPANTYNLRVHFEL